MPDKFPVIYSSFYKHNEFLTDDSPNRGNLLCLQSLQNCTNEISFQFARHDSILSNTGKFAIQIERVNQKCSNTKKNNLMTHASTYLKIEKLIEKYPPRVSTTSVLNFLSR